MTSHDIVSELGAIRTELKWMKAVGVAVIAAVGTLYWAMFDMNATLAEHGVMLQDISEKLAQVLDKLP